MGSTPQLVPECALWVQKHGEGATCQWPGVGPQDPLGHPPEGAPETPPPPITPPRDPTSSNHNP